MLVNPPSTALPVEDSSVNAGALLAAVFSKVSQTISGPNPLTLDPLALEEEAQRFVDIGSLDPDFWSPDAGDAYNFGPQLDPMLSSLPPTVLTSAEFDLDALPQAGSGEFYQTSNGRLVFSRGVGEAPDNKANTNNPAYQARARFVTQAYNYVLSNFNTEAAGQHRDHDAPVTGQRSANSDHYSSGAFDVRAANTAEAQRILVWASTQPWVSFAQIYSDGTLIHISANVAVFGGGIGSGAPATLPGRPGVPAQSKAPAIDTTLARPVTNPGTSGPQ